LKLNKQSAPEVVMIGNHSLRVRSHLSSSGNCPHIAAYPGRWNEPRLRWEKTENVLWRIYHGELDGFQAQNIFLLIGTNNLLFNAGR